MPTKFKYRYRSFETAKSFEQETTDNKTIVWLSRHHAVIMNYEAVVMNFSWRFRTLRTVLLISNKNNIFVDLVGVTFMGKWPVWSLLNMIRLWHVVCDGLEYSLNGKKYVEEWTIAYPGG